MFAPPTRRRPAAWPARVLLLAVLLAAWSTPSAAQFRQAQTSDNEDVPQVTRTVAIEGARIVQAPGRVLDRGTVVLRDGLILAVGRDVAVPYDAERIPGDSLTVYAGFLDALSHAGVPKPKPDAGRRERSFDPGNPPDDEAGIQPDRNVRDLLDAGDASIEALRNLGFTIAHTVPHGGLLPGSGSLILLGGRDAHALVLRPDVSFFAQFERARGVYPSTPMGMMAKLRQLYREAARRRQAETRYAANPAGMERPPFDPVHAAFYPVLDGKRPVFFYTDGIESALDVRNVLQLRRDLGFPLVLAGLNQAFALVDVLKAADVPLVLTLGQPEDPDAPKDARRPGRRGDTPPDSARTITPEAPDSFFDSDLRTRSHADVDAETKNLKARQALVRQHYANTADTLHRAGLRFAFSTRDVKPDAIRPNLRKMIAAGLPEDAALAALTTDAARLLGVERQAGTVEPGKLANLVVTKGSYFDEKGEVRYVFVEGRKFENKPAARPKAEGNGAAPVAGTWRFSVDTPEGAYTGLLTLEGPAARLGGSITSPVLSSPGALRSVALDGQTVTFHVETAEFGRLEASLRFDGDAFEGTLTVPGTGPLPIKGTRETPGNGGKVGKW